MAQFDPAVRSLLFCPAHLQERIAKAHSRQADAIVLDLEDAVPASEKARARAALADSVALLVAAGCQVWVRLGASDCAEDIAAAAIGGVSGLVVPKVDSAAQLQQLDSALATLERANTLSPGAIGLIAQIESLVGLAAVNDIAAACQRLVGISLGSEDFSLAAGMNPTPETLYWPSQQIVFAARLAGIEPLGFPASIADYSDLDVFRQTVVRAREMGFRAALCIHPNQVAVLNTEFRPSPQALQQARELIARFDAAQAQGLGAVEVDGRMVDAPVANAARQLLQQNQSE